MSLTVSGPGGNDTETQTSLIHVEGGIEPERFVTRITGTTGDSLVYGTYFYMSTKVSYIGIYNKKESHSTFWFADVDIPQGAQIVSAWIRLPASQDLSIHVHSEDRGLRSKLCEPCLKVCRLAEPSKDECNRPLEHGNLAEGKVVFHA